MKRVILPLAAFAALCLAASPLAKASTTYDGTLTNPPGFYNGTGGVNNGWTIVADNGIEIGLRAMLRQNPADISNGTNTYFVPLGPQTDITSGGNGANPARAAWNFDFSINLQPNNPNGPSNGLTLQGVTATLTMTGTKSFGPINPLTAFSDNAGWGGVEHDPALPTDWGAQNSENLVFFPIGFDMNQDGIYNFTLNVYGPGATPFVAGRLLATDNITVVAGNPVPLPAAAPAGLGLLGTLGLGVVARKRKRGKKKGPVLLGSPI